MFIEKDWLMKQEQINDQLRQRADERAHRISSERRRINFRALASKKVFQRSPASAERLLPSGGLRGAGG